MRSRLLGAMVVCTGVLVLTSFAAACSDDDDSPAAGETLPPIQTTSTTSTTLPTTTTQPRYYEVQSGDTLAKIAAAYGLPITAIIEANKDLILDPNAIQAGWILSLPLASEIVANSLPAVTSATTVPAPTASPAFTTVAP